MKIQAIIHEAEEGGYWAEVPALPGCVTEGDTMEELEHNLREAVEGFLEVIAERNTKNQANLTLINI
ncbi:MAG TPA: type II toxin-antitoxin system HicB family antitoxin [Allocoleopsis sp.]